jgi:hypothetical protein
MNQINWSWCRGLLAASADLNFENVPLHNIHFFRIPFAIKPLPFPVLFWKLLEFEILA